MALNAVQNIEQAANPTEKRAIRAVLIGPPSSGKGTQVIFKKIFMGFQKASLGLKKFKLTSMKIFDFF